MLLIVAAGALAIAQPGNLGGDDDDTAAPAQETTTTSTTVAETTTTIAVPDPTVDGSGTATSVPGETTTTIAGSGIGTSEPPTGGSDGIADTGRESMLGAGLVLAALGLGLRRMAHTRPA